LPRKTIARLYFNGAEKYIGIFDEQKNKEKHHVTALDDIYKYSEKLNFQGPQNYTRASCISQF